QLSHSNATFWRWSSGILSGIRLRSCVLLAATASFIGLFNLHFWLALRLIDHNARFSSFIVHGRWSFVFLHVYMSLRIRLLNAYLRFGRLDLHLGLLLRLRNLYSRRRLINLHLWLNHRDVNVGPRHFYNDFGLRNVDSHRWSGLSHRNLGLRLMYR